MVFSQTAVSSHCKPTTNNRQRKQMEPTFRCGTKIAIEELAEELNLPHRPGIQDWSYEVSNADDIDRYITHYGLTTNEDKKFILMEMILQAIVDQSDEMQLMTYWLKIKPILIKDFSIHEFTIKYWKNLTKANFDNCKILGSLLRQIGMHRA